MSALSKFSTMKRPLGGVTGAAGTGGGAVVGGGVAGSASGRPGWRGPTETGGSGVDGSTWTVTVGDGTGPRGGVEIFGAGVRVAHPATSERTTVLATKPVTLLLRRIAHAGWQTAQQVRWERPPAGNDRWGDAWLARHADDGRLPAGRDHPRLRGLRGRLGRLRRPGRGGGRRDHARQRGRHARRRRGRRGRRRAGLAGLVQAHVHRAAGPVDRHAVGLDRLHGRALDLVADAIARHTLGRGIFEIRDRAADVAHDDAEQVRPRDRQRRRRRAAGRLGARGAEQVARGDDVVGARRRLRRVGHRRRGRPGGPAAADGQGHRRDELADDVHDQQRRRGGERKIQGHESPRHYAFALPGGRMKPDTVSVANSSFGWLTFTTLTRRSLTVNNFCAPSTRASRSTSWRISADTAISTGISSSSPRSSGGRMRSLRISVLASAAMSLTSFCSSEAATAGAAAVSRRALSLSIPALAASSSAAIWPRRARRSIRRTSSRSRSGTRSAVAVLLLSRGLRTKSQPRTSTASAAPPSTMARSLGESRPSHRITGGGLPVASWAGAAAADPAAADSARARRARSGRRRGWGRRCRAAGRRRARAPRLRAPASSRRRRRLPTPRGCGTAPCCRGLA